MCLSLALVAPEACSWVRPRRMLGVAAHFVTKSRRYSTTLGALRVARPAYRAERDTEQPAGEDDDDSTLVPAAWEYFGSGYLNPGDVLLAAGVEASLPPDAAPGG